MKTLEEMSSAELKVIQLRRKIDTCEKSLNALATSLVRARGKQAARRTELARQEARLKTPPTAPSAKEFEQRLPQVTNKTLF